jgi:membrane complex biogenesis BtpA family protein
MLHVDALPGTPAESASPRDDASARAGRATSRTIEAAIERAVAEARVYRDAGFTALAIENMHDRPYLLRGVGPEIVAAMTAIGREVRRAVDLPLGIQVLTGANRESLAVALACGASFVRVEGFVFAHVADEGLIEADAAGLLRYRRAIGAEHVAIFADVKKKHSSHAITADLDVAETARTAEFSLADGVVVTGIATGREANPEEITEVSGAIEIPVFVGSGINAKNLLFFAAADGFIVGSSVKQSGAWSNPLDPVRTRAMAEAFRGLVGRP